MERDVRIGRQSIRQIGNDSMDSSSVVDLRNEIQLLVSSIQERPVVSLTMVFPPIGIATHG
jgi:hypothetical protein